MQLNFWMAMMKCDFPDNDKLYEKNTHTHKVTHRSEANKRKVAGLSITFKLRATWCHAHTDWWRQYSE